MDGFDDAFVDLILTVLATTHYLDDVPNGHVVVVDLTGDRLESRRMSPEEASRIVDPATAPGSVHPRLVPPDEFVAEAAAVGIGQDARQWPVLFTENGKPAAIAFVRSSRPAPERPPIGVVREWLEREAGLVLAQATMCGWLHKLRVGEVIEIDISSNAIGTTTIERIERVLADVGRPSCERRDLDAWLPRARTTSLHPVVAFATVPGYDAPVVSLTFVEPDRRTSVGGCSADLAWQVELVSCDGRKTETGCWTQEARQEQGLVPEGNEGATTRKSLPGSPEARTSSVARDGLASARLRHRRDRGDRRPG